MKIIVTLTSFPIRINKVWVVIETILRQTVKPDQIILWLSKEQFPSLNNLPSQLLKMTKRGLRIELKDKDLRSHKKYYYALKEYSEDIIITIDDDIFYPSNLIEELMKTHEKFPNSVITKYGQEIVLEKNKIIPYRFWYSNFEQITPNFKVFFGSGGGTLFPPHSLPTETLDESIFMENCLDADDVWLNTMCRLKKTKIFKISTNQITYLPIIIRNNESLFQINVTQNKNDEQIKKLREYFIKNKSIDPFSTTLINAD